jgi:trichohyalin
LERESQKYFESENQYQIELDKERLKRIEAEKKIIEVEKKRIETEKKRIEAEQKRIEAEQECEDFVLQLVTERQKRTDLEQKCAHYEVQVARGKHECRMRIEVEKECIEVDQKRIDAKEKCIEAEKKLNEVRLKCIEAKKKFIEADSKRIDAEKKCDEAEQKMTEMREEIEREREEWRCKICLNRKIEILLSCGHALCQTCLPHSPRCPYCRAGITSTTKMFI